MFLNKDFKEMLIALNDAGAEYLIVGAYALAVHGHMRATGDIDIWVRPSPENAQKVWNALIAYRAPRNDLSPEDFCDPDVVYQIGVEPARIDFLTSIDGVAFEAAWGRRREKKYEDVTFFVLGRQDLLTNKIASGRPKDLVDAKWLKDHE